MIVPWLGSLLTACLCRNTAPEPVAELVVEDESPPKVQATVAQEAMYKALSNRDEGPGCAAVEAMTETPAEDLAWLTENALSPPWVGTRAATCLLAGHGEQSIELFRVWVTDPSQAGFGALVLGNLGLLPPDLALELATLALTEGPDPEAARERISRHEDPALQALLTTP